jgi:large subunit ribosomal protein L3
MALAGYKVGMTRAMLQDGKKGSPTFGQEVSTPVTILECPPVKVIGVRSYGDSPKGLAAIKDAIIRELDKNVARKIKAGKFDQEKSLAEMEKSIDKALRVRLVVSTQPVETGMGKKKPEIFEVEVGGKSAKEKLDYAKQVLGKTVSLTDVV